MITFLYLGKFQSDTDNWMHIHRVLGEYELMIVDSGTLYIADEHTSYTIGKNEYLIMPPTKEQYGTKPSACSFHWLHFQTDEELPCPKKGVIKDWNAILSLLNLMLEKEYKNHSLVTQSLFRSLLAELYYENSAVAKLTPKPLRERIDEYIRFDHESILLVRNIAKALGYHEKYLSRIFYQENHCTLKHYLMEKNMEKGKSLLLNTRLPIYEIATRCGFCDPHNFSRAFRQMYHISPSAMRRTFEQKKQWQCKLPKS